MFFLFVCLKRYRISNQRFFHFDFFDFFLRLDATRFADACVACRLCRCGSAAPPPASATCPREIVSCPAVQPVAD